MLVVPVFFRLWCDEALIWGVGFVAVGSRIVSQNNNVTLEPSRQKAQIPPISAGFFCVICLEITVFGHHFE